MRSRREIVNIVCLVGILLGWILPICGFGNIFFMTWIVMMLNDYLKIFPGISNWLDKQVKVNF